MVPSSEQVASAAVDAAFSPMVSAAARATASATASAVEWGPHTSRYAGGPGCRVMYSECVYGATGSWKMNSILYLPGLSADLFVFLMSNTHS